MTDLLSCEQETELSECIRDRATMAKRIELCKGRIYSIEIPSGNLGHLTLLKGEAWITMEGDSMDYVLTAGEEWNVHARGRLVIQALCSTSFTIEVCPASAPVHCA